MITLDDSCSALVTGSELVLRSSTREIRLRSDSSPTVHEWLAAIEAALHSGSASIEHVVSETVPAAAPIAVPAAAPVAALAPSPAADLSPAGLTRYTEPNEIWNALETGNVRLVKASYLIKLDSEGGVLHRRQELPSDAFISVTEIKELYGPGNRDGVLPIISISFCAPWPFLPARPQVPVPEYASVWDRRLGYCPSP